MKNFAINMRANAYDKYARWQRPSGRFSTLRKLNNWLVPALCPLCGEVQESSSALVCNCCAANIAPNPAGCALCNDQIENGSICGRCITKPPAFDSLSAPWLYKTPMDELIGKAKFYENYALAYQLGLAAADYFLACYSEPYSEPMPQALVPVPLYIGRLAERGYNQASLIADGISKISNVPVFKNIVYKNLATPAQSTLGVKTRATNLRNSYVAHKLSGIHHLAIVDDVATSGSTFNELSRELKNVGYQRVDCWCLARSKKQ
ncbi:MAG: ComF family protein [Proteobacteria bacterium]|nr:ComF family protein [Pseudomonadota bacterium]